MSRRITLFFSAVGAVALLLGGELVFLVSKKSDTASKRAVVSLAALPDLAVATEARFLRFRSLSDIYSPFNEGPELLDYFPASFTYAPAYRGARMPSRVVNNP
jgi:hypothetical protein